MQINVAEELKSIGKTTDRHLEENLEPISFGGNKLVFTMPLSVDVRSSFDGEGFSVSGVLSSELLMHCTKCNKEFKQGFNIDFSERFKIILSPDIFDLLDMSSISGFPLKTASFFDGKIERALADALRRSVDILTLPRARISPIFSSPDFNESTSSSSHSRLISAFFTTTLFFTLNLFAFPPWSRLA